MPSNVLDPILQAGPLARFVLGVLLFFSVICWALIVEKWWEFRAIKRDSRGFMRAFREARRFSLIYGAAKKFRSSPAAQLYSAAGLELSNIYGGPDQVDTALEDGEGLPREDRKSTRLNSSHITISYAVFCLKKKKTTKN